MNLTQLEKLAKSIKNKGLEVNTDTLQIESLFHNFGTLNEESTSDLLWQKRNEFEIRAKRMYPNKSDFIICPSSLMFNYWAGDKNTVSILGKN